MVASGIKGVRKMAKITGFDFDEDVLSAFCVSDRLENTEHGVMNDIQVKYFSKEAQLEHANHLNIFDEEIAVFMKTQHEDDFLKDMQQFVANKKNEKIN